MDPDAYHPKGLGTNGWRRAFVRSVYFARAPWRRQTLFDRTVETILAEWRAAEAERELRPAISSLTSTSRVCVTNTTPLSTPAKATPTISGVGPARNWRARNQPSLVERLRVDLQHRSDSRPGSRRAALFISAVTVTPGGRRLSTSRPALPRRYPGRSPRPPSGEPPGAPQPLPFLADVPCHEVSVG